MATPILDAGNLGALHIAPPISDLGPVRVAVDAEKTAETFHKLHVRTGAATNVPEEATWSAWRAFDGPAAVLENPRGRFLQVKVELGTQRPLADAASEGVDSVRDAEAGKRLGQGNWRHRARRPVGCPYHPSPSSTNRCDHPRLKQRPRDTTTSTEVVAGATSRTRADRARLAAWSSRRWAQGPPRADIYPPWDALEILKPHADGTPVGGFCQQYNVVFLQACESFGIPGRAVSIGAGDHGGKIRGGGTRSSSSGRTSHRKWVYVDGNMAWYAVDAQTGVPLSLLGAAPAAAAASCGGQAGRRRSAWSTLARGRQAVGGPRPDWPPFLRTAADPAEQLPRGEVAAAAQPGDARLVLDRAPRLDRRRLPGEPALRPPRQPTGATGSGR